MRIALHNTKSYELGIRHFLLAGIVFTVLLGAIAQLAALVVIGPKAVTLLQGITGIGLDIIIVWLSVVLSSRWIKIPKKANPTIIAVVATICSAVMMLISAPFFAFFAEVSFTSTEFIFLKNIVHLLVFYFSTRIFLISNRG